MAGKESGVTAEEGENAFNLAEELHWAFSWVDTPQGAPYWADVYFNLMELSRTCEKSA